MCECLKNIRKKLKEEEYPEATLNTTFEMDIEGNNGMREKAGKLEISYRKRKKDGNLSNKNKKTNILFTHCPFCGEKY